MILRFRAIALATTGLALAAAAQAGCYTVFNADGRIVSQTSTAPVDMSLPLHETVPARYGPGARLVFGIAEDNCGPRGDPYADAQTRASASDRNAPMVIRAPKADRG